MIVAHLNEGFEGGLGQPKAAESSGCKRHVALIIARFGHSCDRMCMPRVDAKLFMEALKRLIDLDRDWVPKSPDALYIRPTMISTQRGLGVKAAADR